MAYNALPSAGSTDWYPHYRDLDHATSGVVQLDSFPGATDDAKLTAALTYAAAQTRIPWIQYPARSVTHSQSGRTPFSGMKLVGPDPAMVSKNYELDSGKLVSHRVRLNVGEGNNSWFVGGGTLNGISVSNMMFDATGSAQFWHQPLSGGNGLYSCNFNSLSFFGFKHVFGLPNDAAAFTQVVLSGHWQCISPFATQFTLRGSDNQLWADGFINIHGMRTDVPGTALIHLASLKKTKVGYVYLTAQNVAWEGLRISGSGSSGLSFFGGVYEGRNASTQASGRLVRIEGGSCVFYGTNFNFGMLNSSHNGIIEVTGGDVVLDRPYYDRGNTSNTVPFVYQTGGHLAVRRAVGVGSGTPVVRYTGGTRDLDSSVTASAA